MMKKRLVLFISLFCLMIVSANAQTVPEMVQAPARVTGEYTSPSGRTTVSLNAEVIVPDVAVMPIVEVH